MIYLTLVYVQKTVNNEVKSKIFLIICYFLNYFYLYRLKTHFLTPFFTYLMPSLRAGGPWQQGNHRVSSFVPLPNHIPDKTVRMEFLQYI